MIIYHGSKVIVEKPLYGCGKTENDYGQGFYCTESLDLAKEWACPVLQDGFANKYTLDLDGLSVLRLNDGQFHILNWLALLLHNRKVDLNRNQAVAIRGKDYIIKNFLPDTAGYDVITGYRADDRYFAFARDFVQNGISVRQLAQAMKLGELGEQIVLKSERAFGQIRFDGCEVADCGVYYQRRQAREQRANDTFNSMHNAADFLETDLFMLDILREGVTNDDPRLR